MTTLRDRCKEIARTLSRDAMLRQGDPVETILAFVCAEIGRKADPSLDKTLPLVLYFGSDADRDEFVEAVRIAKPNMISRKFP